MPIEFGKKITEVAGVGKLGMRIWLTLLVTLSFFPCPTYCDFETADSRRERVLLSRDCSIYVISDVLHGAPIPIPSLGTPNEQCLHSPKHS